MFDSIKLKLVQTEDDFEEVRLFALTFEHELMPEHKKLPIYKVLNLEGKLISFIMLKTVPIALCGWGPDISARELENTIAHFRHWDTLDASMTGRDIGYVGVDLGNKVFTPEMMERLNFHRVGLELYKAK